MQSYFNIKLKNIDLKWSKFFLQYDLILFLRHMSLKQKMNLLNQSIWALISYKKFIE